jgi:glycosyltransferase involved in cell wall biosynthesis
LLEQARYLVIPSQWYENAPVAVIEAAAYGLGVIASRIGGLPEFVRDGRTGLLFEPDDADALAAIMRGLVDGTIVLPELSEACEELIEQHTVERMVEGYLRHYAALVRARRQGAASESLLTARPSARGGWEEGAPHVG